MDNLWFWVLFLAIAVVAIGVWFAAYQAEKLREEQLGAVASRLGFQFWPESQSRLVERLSIFQLFSQGHSRKAWNIMNGHAGDVKVQLFDYKYVTGGGKSSRTWKQTVILFESDRLRLPAFSLRPQGFWDRIAGAFGQQDIEFEASPDFSAHSRRVTDNHRLAGLTSVF